MNDEDAYDEAIADELADAPPVPEFTVDLDNLPQQGHIWIDRGEKMSCENAGHPYHQAFKRRK